MAITARPAAWQRVNCAHDSSLPAAIIAAEPQAPPDFESVQDTGKALLTAAVHYASGARAMLWSWRPIQYWPGP